MGQPSWKFATLRELLRLSPSSSNNGSPVVSPSTSINWNGEQQQRPADTAASAAARAATSAAPSAAIPISSGAADNSSSSGCDSPFPSSHSSSEARNSGSRSAPPHPPRTSRGPSATSTGSSDCNSGSSSGSDCSQSNSSGEEGKPLPVRAHGGLIVGGLRGSALAEGIGDGGAAAFRCRVQRAPPLSAARAAAAAFSLATAPALHSRSSASFSPASSWLFKAAEDPEAAEAPTRLWSLLPSFSCSNNLPPAAAPVAAAAGPSASATTWVADPVAAADEETVGSSAAASSSCNEPAWDYKEWALSQNAATLLQQQQPTRGGEAQTPLRTETASSPAADVETFCASRNRLAAASSSSGGGAPVLQQQVGPREERGEPGWGGAAAAAKSGSGGSSDSKRQVCSPVCCASEGDAEAAAAADTQTTATAGIRRIQTGAAWHGGPDRELLLKLQLRPQQQQPECGQVYVWGSRVRGLQSATLAAAVLGPAEDTLTAEQKATLPRIRLPSLGNEAFCYPLPPAVLHTSRTAASLTPELMVLQRPVLPRQMLRGGRLSSCSSVGSSSNSRVRKALPAAATETEEERKAAAAFQAALKQLQLTPRSVLTLPLPERKKLLHNMLRVFCFEFIDGVTLRQLTASRECVAVHCRLTADLQTLLLDVRSGRVLEFPLNQIQAVYTLARKTAGASTNASSTLSVAGIEAARAAAAAAAGEKQRQEAATSEQQEQQQQPHPRRRTVLLRDAVATVPTAAENSAQRPTSSSSGSNSSSGSSSTSGSSSGSGSSSSGTSNGSSGVSNSSSRSHGSGGSWEISGSAEEDEEEERQQQKRKADEGEEDDGRGETAGAESQQRQREAEEAAELAAAATELVAFAQANDDDPAAQAAEQEGEEQQQRRNLLDSSDEEEEDEENEEEEERAAANGAGKGNSGTFSASKSPGWFSSSGAQVTLPRLDLRRLRQQQQEDEEEEQQQEQQQQHQRLQQQQQQSLQQHVEKTFAYMMPSTPRYAGLPRASGAAAGRSRRGGAAAAAGRAAEKRIFCCGEGGLETDEEDDDDDGSDDNLPPQFIVVLDFVRRKLALVFRDRTQAGTFELGLALLAKACHQPPPPSALASLAAAAQNSSYTPRAAQVLLDALAGVRPTTASRNSTSVGSFNSFGSQRSCCFAVPDAAAPSSDTLPTVYGR